MVAEASPRLVRMLEIIAKCQLKRLLVIMNGSSISYGFIMNVYSFWVRGSRLNCNGYRSKAKLMQII